MIPRTATPGKEGLVLKGQFLLTPADATEQYLAAVLLPALQYEKTVAEAVAEELLEVSD
jgi:hypothetical protein